MFGLTICTCVAFMTSDLQTPCACKIMCFSPNIFMMACYVHTLYHSAEISLAWWDVKGGKGLGGRGGEWGGKDWGITFLEKSPPYMGWGGGAGVRAGVGGL